MKSVFKSLLILCVLASLLGVGPVMADSADEHIKNLKSADPSIRAKAAYELGCS